MPEDTKELRLDQARVLRVQGEVFRGHVFPWQATPPVEVLGADGARIGWGTLDVMLDGVSQMALCYDSPERLDLENGEKLYAWLEGVADLDEAPYEIHGPVALDGITIQHFFVTAIRLVKRPSFASQGYVTVIP